MRHFSVAPSLTVQGRTRKGLRGLSGKPFHPPLTDIPIAAYLFGAVFDVLSGALHSSHPAVAECARCNEPGPHRSFSVPAGGSVCPRCRPPGSATPAG